MTARDTLPLLALALALPLAACPAHPRPATPEGASSASVVVIPASSSPPAGSSPEAPSASASTRPPITIRGAVSAPVISEDACSVDTDCAPLAVCHPDRCVAASKAGVMKPGTMCTMECRGGTLDCGFNRCGCVATSNGSRCAMVPAK